MLWEVDGQVSVLLSSCCVCCNEKGFPPALYSKATNRTSKDRCWGGSSTITPKRNERETTKEKNADNGGSTETKKLHGHFAHRGSPTKLQGSEAPVPISTSRGTATKTTLLPRVSPGTRRGERKGRPRRPPGRSGDTHRRRRVGVGQADRGFPRSQPSPRVLQSLPPNRPPTCATMVKKPPRRLTTAPRGEVCTTRDRSRD